MIGFFGNPLSFDVDESVGAAGNRQEKKVRREPSFFPGNTAWVFFGETAAAPPLYFAKDRAA